MERAARRTGSNALGRLMIRLIPLLVVGILALFGYRIWRVVRTEQLDHQMIEAIIAGREQKALEALEAGAHPDAQQRPKREIRSLSDIVALLRGERSGVPGPSALCLAVRHGQARLADQLLQHGSKGVHDTINGHCLLSEAVLLDRADLADILLRHGADEVDDILAESHRFSLLTRAALNGNQALVEMLLDRGARLPSDPAQRDVFSAAVAGKCSLALFERVLTMGGSLRGRKREPDSGQYGPDSPPERSPLCAAAASGRMETVRYLMDHGVGSYPFAGTEGYTDSPLCSAAQNNRADALRYMLDHGKRVGKEVLTLILYSTTESSGNAAAVRVLTERGADVNYDPGDLPCMLVLACGNGDMETVRVLLKFGAHIDLPRGDPLGAAAHYGHLDVVKLLLDRGARVDGGTDPKSATPLMEAAEEGHAEVVKLLLARGANPNVVRKASWVRPRSALSLAGNEEIRRLLLQAGAKR